MTLFAQITSTLSSAAGDPALGAPLGSDRPMWTIFIFYAAILAMVYFAFFRPTIQAKKKQEETIKSAKTGDKVVTTGGIHGVITNVKETTVILRVADNVKLELEKSHIDRVARDTTPETKVAVKA